MKTITLWQPWALLITKGDKKIETRSWKAPKELIGKRMAIHVAKKMPILGKKMCRVFARLLGIKDYTGSWFYYLERGVGPFGRVVATAKLVACVRVIGNTDDEQADLENGMTVKGNELAFGDYSLGRYAWILEDIQPLEEPIPAKGMQKLWNWEG